MLDSVELSSIAVSALSDAKAVDIQTIDVRQMTDITDMMVICHGTSDRHVSALAQHVISALIEKDCKPASIEGEEVGEWILIDYIDVLIHIMKKATREHYDLESLWDQRLTKRAAAKGVKSA